MPAGGKRRRQESQGPPGKERRKEKERKGGREEIETLIKGETKKLKGKTKERKKIINLNYRRRHPTIETVLALTKITKGQPIRKKKPAELKAGSQC